MIHIYIIIYTVLKYIIITIFFLERQFHSQANESFGSFSKRYLISS